MGRHVAGESFLRGYLDHGKCEDFAIQVEAGKHSKVFDQFAPPVTPCQRLRRGSVAETAAVEGGAGAGEQRLQQVQSDEGNDCR